MLRAQEGSAKEAFELLREVLSIHETLFNGLGVQSALGYLARVAAQADQFERALVLAEKSLEIGREVHDRFGQLITLNLQVGCFAQVGNTESAVATCVVAASTGLPLDQFPQIGAVVTQVANEGELDDDAAEEVRRSGIVRAQKQLDEASTDPLGPL